jgi:AcrR family transcriptional regulator
MSKHAASSQAPEEISAEKGKESRLLYRPPKQSRSQQTLDRIATAALVLMEEKGVEKATIAEIVKRAEASVGSFYARFAGKDDLIRHLQENVWTDARERWNHALQAEAWEGLSMARVVEGVVGLLLRSLVADFHRRKVLGRDRGLDPESARLVLSFHQHILSTVTPLLLARRSEITHPDPEAAVLFGYRMVVGAVREFLEMEDVRALSRTGGTDSLIPENLGTELARAWSGYLNPKAERSGGVDEGEVDFFDPWG